MTNMQDYSTLFSSMLNPFLFLAVGFYWIVLSPRLLGSWFLLAGGCLLFLNEAIAYYDATHLTELSWVANGSYAMGAATAPFLLALGIMFVVRAETESCR